MDERAEQLVYTLTDVTYIYNNALFVGNRTSKEIWDIDRSAMTAFLNEFMDLVRDPGRMPTLPVQGKRMLLNGMRDIMGDLSVSVLARSFPNRYGQTRRPRYSIDFITVHDTIHVGAPTTTYMVKRLSGYELFSISFILHLMEKVHSLYAVTPFSFRDS